MSQPHPNVIFIAQGKPSARKPSCGANGCEFSIYGFRSREDVRGGILRCRGKREVRFSPELLLPFREVGEFTTAPIHRPKIHVSERSQFLQTVLLLEFVELHIAERLMFRRSEERRVGKECRSRWTAEH